MALLKELSEDFLNMFPVGLIECYIIALGTSGRNSFITPRFFKLFSMNLTVNMYDKTSKSNIGKVV